MKLRRWLLADPVRVVCGGVGGGSRSQRSRIVLVLPAMTMVLLFLLLLSFRTTASTASTTVALRRGTLSALTKRAMSFAEAGEREKGVSILESALRRNTGVVQPRAKQNKEEAQVLALIGTILLHDTTVAASSANARAKHVHLSPEIVERAIYAFEQALDRNAGHTATLKSLAAARAAMHTCLLVDSCRGASSLSNRGTVGADTALRSVTLDGRTPATARKDFAALHHWLTSESAMASPQQRPGGVSQRPISRRGLLQNVSGTAARADVDIVWSEEGGGRIVAGRDFAPGETIISMSQAMFHVSGDGEDVNEVPRSVVAGKERQRFLKFVKNMRPPSFPPLAGTVPFIVWWQNFVDALAVRNTGTAATSNPPTRHGPLLISAAYASFDYSSSSPSSSTFWSDDELAWIAPPSLRKEVPLANKLSSSLASSAQWAIDLYEDFRANRRRVDSFCSVLPMLRARFPTQLPASHFTCEGFKKMVLFVKSRMVQLQSQNVYSLLAFIPYHWQMDHTHTGTSNTVNFYPSLGKPGYQNVAGSRPIKRGEQLTMSYHPTMSNAETLCEYDFVHSPNADPLGNWIPLLMPDLTQAARDVLYTAKRKTPPATWEKKSRAATSATLTKCAGVIDKYGNEDPGRVLRAFNTTTAPVPGTYQAAHVFERGVLSVIAVAVSRNPARTMRSVLVGRREGGGNGGECNPLLPDALEHWRGNRGNKLSSVAADVVARWMHITIERIEAWLRSASPAPSTPLHRVRGVRQIAQERIRICKRAASLLSGDGEA